MPSTNPVVKYRPKPDFKPVLQWLADSEDMPLATYIDHTMRGAVAEYERKFGPIDLDDSTDTAPRYRGSAKHKCPLYYTGSDDEQTLALCRAVKECGMRDRLTGRCVVMGVSKTYGRTSSGSRGGNR